MKPIGILMIILIMFVGGCITYPQQTYSPSSYDLEEDLNRRIKRATELGEQKRLSRAEELRNDKELQSKNWSEEVKQAIINSDIAIGMTKEQVIYSWGHPIDINKSVGSWGVHEQWKYGEAFMPYRPKDTYLHFENGTLASYSN